MEVIRCDRYTPDEFRKYMRGRARRETVDQYIADHPKEAYDTDDEISVIHISQDRYDYHHRPLWQPCGGGFRTKRYDYPEKYD